MDMTSKFHTCVTFAATDLHTYMIVNSQNYIFCPKKEQKSILQ